MHFHSRKCIWKHHLENGRHLVSASISYYTQWHMYTEYQLISPKFHIYASVNWVNIISGNGLSPRQHRAIIWTNADILSIRPKGIYSNEIIFEIQIFSFKKMHLNMSSAKWRPFCPGGDELMRLLPQHLRYNLLMKSTCYRNDAHVTSNSHPVAFEGYNMRTLAPQSSN